MAPSVSQQLRLSGVGETRKRRDKVRRSGAWWWFPDDPYDRYWGLRTMSSWAKLSTKETIKQDDVFVVPIPILQTVVAPINNGTVLHVNTWVSYKTSSEFKFILHFADIQNAQLRLFDIYMNNDEWYPNYSPPYLAAGHVRNTEWYKTTDGQYNITLAATNTSMLPPMLNAYEGYLRIPHDTPRTFSEDFDAMTAIKLEYGVRKNWMGDPCFPEKYRWNGVKCSDVTDNTTRIISLDLSNNNMSGLVSDNFTLLTELRFLYESVSIQDSPREQELESALRSTKSQGGHLQNTENRRFTYKDLEKFTNKFQRSIGKGGFGLVYYGRLEDNTEVAVKMRSESSSHGLDEFLAEVNSLTKVHHRNLVSLVGYCWEKEHLALVYEYMSQGNLCDHLRGKNGADEPLSWATRVRVVLEAAQGLDYLHKGCSLPIIHRDVKTNNILIGQNLQAKIADFGLCKTYLSDMQTHISTNAAGTAGYMDPEYYHTGWLSESSDVYSFGVVLLEVATGEPPVLPGHGHIVQRVKQKIATGNVTTVADAHLRGEYDVNSMWKLVDTAMACTADAAVRRPTMAAVVAQLKESLALEEAREDSSVIGSIASTTGAPMPEFGPSAR
uniref:Putative receptor-like protein kinase n=1 Tax=Aegilops tauschii TaxID=37682 RepID=R7W5Z6_AEGTA